MKDEPKVLDQERYSGIAALSICEALMLALNDHNILPEKEFVGILQDAANAHDNAAGLDNAKEMHEQVALMIKGIIAGGNSVRRP
ncbi:MAG: hypothetical protein KKB02_20030 [Alphaproteobacteria bacterium]|nr:hypothetical protein [Alphaproteobacteria bacterium]